MMLFLSSCGLYGEVYYSDESINKDDNSTTVVTTSHTTREILTFFRKLKNLLTFLTGLLYGPNMMSETANPNREQPMWIKSN